MPVTFTLLVVEQKITNFWIKFLISQTDLGFKKEPLDRIDNELMQAKTVLVDITEPRRLCLQELGQRKNFVMWVKEALEGKYLKTQHKKTRKPQETRLKVSI